MREGLLDRRDATLPGDLLRLRTQQGVSEEELGERIGRDAKTIRNYEAGTVRPQDWTVQALNDVLVGRNSWGVTVTDTPEDARAYFSLAEIPDEVLEAEVQRRRL